MTKLDSARWLTNCTNGHLRVWVRRNDKMCFCGADRDWFRVEGAAKETRCSKGYRNCDARCTGAVGPECVCQCNGLNHGAEHLMGNHQLVAF